MGDLAGVRVWFFAIPVARVEEAAVTPPPQPRGERNNPVNVARIKATRARGLLPHRRARILLGVAGAIAVASVTTGASLASAATQSAARPAGTPTVDVVGTGQVTCNAATGEVGYSPASMVQAPGHQGPLTVSIWFQATQCAAAKGTAVKPVPKTVIGSISFTMPNGCPLSGWMGQGTLNLAYNYPPVPGPVMIDPSVASATVSNYGLTPYWTISGQVVAGSYLSTNLVIKLKPDVIGSTQNCKSGITSEWIVRAQTPFVSGI